MRHAIRKKGDLAALRRHLRAERSVYNPQQTQGLSLGSDCYGMAPQRPLFHDCRNRFYKVFVPSGGGIRVERNCSGIQAAV